MSVPANAVYYMEIITPDPKATADFYTASYGWQFESAVPEFGNAWLATLPSGTQCGIRAPMHDQEKPIVRNYLRVEDIDAAVAKAGEQGAQIALPPMEIPGRGRIAIYFVGGIEQGLWQP